MTTGLGSCAFPNPFKQNCSATAGRTLVRGIGRGPPPPPGPSRARRHQRATRSPSSPCRPPAHPHPRPSARQVFDTDPSCLVRVYVLSDPNCSDYDQLTVMDG